jgi:hypothetical protein
VFMHDWFQSVTLLTLRPSSCKISNATYANSYFNLDILFPVSFSS